VADRAELEAEPLPALGLRHRRWPPGVGGGGAELAQPILELPVAELHSSFWPGQLPELVFQPLDPHFQVGVVGLPLDLRRALLANAPTGT